MSNKERDELSDEEIAKVSGAGTSRDRGGLGGVVKGSGVEETNTTPGGTTTGGGGISSEPGNNPGGLNG
jgi:hypothetical protein